PAAGEQLALGLGVAGDAIARPREVFALRCQRRIDLRRRAVCLGARADAAQRQCRDAEGREKAHRVCCPSFETRPVAAPQDEVILVPCAPLTLRSARSARLEGWQHVALSVTRGHGLPPHWG